MAMRMRKKKHADERMEAVGILWEKTPLENKGRWHQIIGADMPLYLEIGCGKGGFISETAKQNPGCFFVALEREKNVIVMAMEKAFSIELKNIRFVLGDANIFLDSFDEDEIDRIYLNFSDPWPKSKHVRRRLTYREFLKNYSRILKDGGEIHMKTDNRMLFDFSLEEFAECGYELKDTTYDLHSSPFAENNIMTEYEKLFSEKGQPIFRTVAVNHKQCVGNQTKQE